jgi:protein-S-isoprenylcysteine O-methyltransferase Ste14
MNEGLLAEDLLTAATPRVLLLGVMLAFLAIRVVFQRRRGDEAREAHRGRRDVWLTRWVTVTQLLPAWLWIGTPFLGFADVDLPVAVRAAGFAVALSSLAFLWWVHDSLGRNFSPWLELRAGHALVTAGPYARIRHPMYTAGFLLALSYGPLSGNLLMGTIPFLGLIPLVLVRLPEEEAMMLLRFGDAYRAYMRRTGRLLPWR